MYEQYLRDPASVGEEWRVLFDNGKLAELPIIPTNRAEVLAALGSGEQGAVGVGAPSATAPPSPRASRPSPAPPPASSRTWASRSASRRRRPSAMSPCRCLTLGARR